MAHLNALSTSSFIQSRLVDFAADALFVRDQKLRDISRHIWSGDSDTGGLISDLWVEAAYPSQSSKHTLDSLVEAGVFHSALCNILHDSTEFPRTRNLFEHQFQAVVAERECQNDTHRPALLITAGTGAGKTEAFQLPILNDLFFERDRKPRDPIQGSACFIVYPMNALVNDQVGRLYRMLYPQNDVKFFHFTSETPEDEKTASRRGIPAYKLCRIRTREQARQQPPDIVITNYSMLEYMLCRPQDQGFFGSNLRAVVLDEAHMYSGTLAAEIKLLLRRLYSIALQVSNREWVHFTEGE